MKRIAKVIGIILIVLLIGIGTFYLIYVRPMADTLFTNKYIEYDKNLTLVIGGGSNSAILNSDSVVFVIETKMLGCAEEFSIRVREIAGSKPVFVVNTHYHSDHVGGNVYFREYTIMAGANYTQQDWTAETSIETLPNKWLKDSLIMRVGDETISMYTLPENGHTQGDIVIYFHNRKMLFTGDYVLTQQNPNTTGIHTSPYGYLAAFDFFQKTFDIKVIVPGHGNIGGTELIATFRNYFLDMKEVAANPSAKDSLFEKYKTWNELPVKMSRNTTVEAWHKVGVQ